MTFPTLRRRLAILAASLLLTFPAVAQTAGAPPQPLPEGLATEAAAQGKSDAESESFEGLLTLALAEQQTLAQLRDAGHWNRAQMAAAVESRLNLTRAGLSQARAKIIDQEPEVRERIAESLAAVDVNEAELQSSVRGARGAEETTWTAARERLAQAFGDYAESVMAVATAIDAALTQTPPAK